MDKALALVVEDSSILAVYFAKVLSDAGYEVEIAEDGQTAMNLLQTCTPDLILLDLNIPKISGEKVLAYIRTEERFADTRILAISGSATRASQVRGKVDLILHKPVEYKQLSRLSKVFHPYYQSTHILPNR
jgi:CheY-like chemotaxis protein